MVLAFTLCDLHAGQRQVQYSLIQRFISQSEKIVLQKMFESKIVLCYLF